MLRYPTTTRVLARLAERGRGSECGARPREAGPRVRAWRPRASGQAVICTTRSSNSTRSNGEKSSTHGMVVVAAAAAMALVGCRYQQLESPGGAIGRTGVCIGISVPTSATVCPVILPPSRRGSLSQVHECASSTLPRRAHRRRFTGRRGQQRCREPRRRVDVVGQPGQTAWQDGGVDQRDLLVLGDPRRIRCRRGPPV